MLKRAVTVAAVGILCASILTVRESVQAATSSTPGPIAIGGFTVSQWVGPNSSYSHPDSVALDGSHVFVGYQNVTAKDGSDNKTSTVVEYGLAGDVVQTFAVPGHNDGLRVDPATHLVWASSNEDGNPAIVTIDPISGKVTPYTFPPAPHGGGYDDIVFTGGAAYIAASNPTLNSSGVNTFPALDQIVLSNGQVFLTPVLAGNATATDITGGSNATVTLNLTDPDSMRVSPQGDVVVSSQGDSELVFAHRPGTPQAAVTRLSVGTQLDDFLWATAPTGRMLIVDGPKNTIWQMTGAFDTNTVFVEAPSDSGVAGFVGTLDMSTGQVTPVAIGFGSPTGLEFIPGAVGGIPLSATLAPSTVPRQRVSERFE